MKIKQEKDFKLVLDMFDESPTNASWMLDAECSEANHGFVYLRFYFVNLVIFTELNL